MIGAAIRPLTLVSLLLKLALKILRALHWFQATGWTPNTPLRSNQHENRPKYLPLYAIICPAL
jgi:hypothetical protein